MCESSEILDDQGLRLEEGGRQVEILRRSLQQNPPLILSERPYL